EPNLSHPHNVLLDFWLRLGVLGVAALVISARTFLRQKPGSGAYARAAGLGAAGAAVALLTHGLMDNSYFLIDLAYGAWTILLIHELASEAPV
ncbi:MAG TPA: O-antigen ligase domain-containing protein, partial [Chloroflexota bacterium]|nr:O-antigen ligase domain-containing protein [Chloroflexota bacterium]